MKIISDETWQTVVAGFEIRLELAKTRPGVFEFGVWNPDPASSFARTPSIGDGKCVPVAADVTHVGLNASTERHSPVTRRIHQYDFVHSTFGSKRLRVAEVATVDYDNMTRPLCLRYVVIGMNSFGSPPMYSYSIPIDTYDLSLTVWLQSVQRGTF